MFKDNSATMIEALQLAAAYDHAAPDIVLLQTHISWVLLAGDYAYKIKKPVDLSFVDFSTLERREQFCHAELRLNRRLAPELYLEVVCISGTPDSPRVNGSGEPMEFAIKMQRFPQDALLNRVIDLGKLLPAHIDHVARKVAEFHARCPTADDETRFGDLEAIWQPVEENFQQLLSGLEKGAFPVWQSGLDGNSHKEGTVPSPQWRERILCLQEWSRCEFDQRQHDFISRKRNGSIRECHGDMHLGNMILKGDQVIVFDCIEFNDNFRWIDVISEIAFLTMDLEDRSRPDLAHRFLNAYLEWTGDYEGLVVIPFYLAYRCLVRAKVDEIRFEQDDLTIAERKRIADDWHGYLLQAGSYTQMPSPMMIITLSGSGKTTGTQPLVESLGAIRIRSDVERKRLLGINPVGRTDTISDDAYSAEMNQRTYRRLAELATAIVRAGFSVVVDATFLKRSSRDDFRILSKQLNVPFALVSFETSQEQLRQRILERETRGLDASEANLDVLDYQLRVREPLQRDESEAAVVVEANVAGPVDPLLEQFERLRHDPGRLLRDASVDG